jgi:hypothetical protein
VMTLEKSQHGFHCTMRGTVTEADIDGYLAEANRLLPVGQSFHLIVDQRDCKVLLGPEQAKMVEVMDFFAQRGLSRVAVVTTSSIVAMQMNRLAAESPAGQIQLAIDGTDPRWAQIALDWVADGKRT